MEYSESSIQLFKTENSVVFSEPKDAGTTERVKYVTTILVNFIIRQGCISLFGEIKNKTNTKQNPQQILKKLEASKETKGKQRLQMTEVKKQRFHAPLTHLIVEIVTGKRVLKLFKPFPGPCFCCKELKLTTKGDSATYQAISEVDGTFSIATVFVPLFKYYECRKIK